MIEKEFYHDARKRCSIENKFGSRSKKKNNAIRQTVESAIHNAVKDGRMNATVSVILYSDDEIDYIKDILVKNEYDVKIDSYSDFRDSWKTLIISWC